MDQFNTLAEKIFSLLKGNGLKIKIFDVDGNEVTDPSTGRRFFVMKPNIMVTIDEDSASVQFTKGSNVKDQQIVSLQKNIRRLADTNVPPLNSTTKIFGKSIQPKDYAYQAKMKKDPAMMENANVNVNSQLMGKIVHLLTSTGTGATATALTREIPGTNFKDMQRALNKLKQDGKLIIQGTDASDGSPIYAVAVEEAVMESFSKMFGSARTSQQTLENVVIKVRHRVPVSEEIRGSRSRSISAIFLECNGERFRFSSTYLPGARAMAQHLAHGGTMNDKVGLYISESTINLLKLQSFNRYVTTNKLINEDSSGIVETVKENIQTLRTELKKLTGSKTYETAKARLETFEREALAEDDTSGLKDLFTIRRFDEKFEEVLPIVKQLVQEKDTFHKRIEEAAGNTITIRREAINTTPMFEFAGENARLGFKISELALRIMENDELAGFIGKIGTKLCKEGVVNDFEKAVLAQVFENVKIENTKPSANKEIKESVAIELYFNRFDYNFM